MNQNMSNQDMRFLSDPRTFLAWRTQKNLTVVNRELKSASV